jgi:hypothetical protein
MDMHFASFVVATLYDVIITSSLFCGSETKAVNITPHFVASPNAAFVLAKDTFFI